MIVLKGEEFENIFKLISQKNYVEENPMWNDIVKYKTALRCAVARKVANDLIVTKRTVGIENFLDDLFDTDFCASQVIEETDSDYPPNMIRIIEKLNGSAQKNSSKELERYVSEIKLYTLSSQSTLYYQKVLGDLYQLIKKNYLVGKKFTKALYENSLSEVIKENGGMKKFEGNIKEYFFGVRRSKAKELLDNYPSLQFIFSSIETQKILVMRSIIDSEIEWYKQVCGQ